MLSLKIISIYTFLRIDSHLSHQYFPSQFLVILKYPQE